MQHELHLTLKGTWRVAAGIAVASSLAAVTVLLADIPVVLRVLLPAAICLAGVRALRLHGFRSSPYALSEITIDREGEAYWRQNNGTEANGRVRVDLSRLYPWLVVLALEDQSSQRILRLPVVRDSVGRDAFRQLKRWLGWRLKAHAD